MRSFNSRGPLHKVSSNWAFIFDHSMILRMFIVKVFLAAATVFSLLVSGVAEAATPDPVHDVVIVVSGDVPGFTHSQLVSFLARKMNEEVSAPWHFVAGIPAQELAPNRVIWSFKKLLVVWKGGSHSGFQSPNNSETNLRAEVKLFVKDIYQMTFDTHPSVRGGIDDKVLSEMVHNVSHALFVENKPDIP